MGEENEIILTATNKENVKEDIIKISSEGFFFRGEKVEDTHDVYNRFHEWLKNAEQSKK